MLRYRDKAEHWIKPEQVTSEGYETGQCDRNDPIIVKSFASTVTKDKFEGQSREGLMGELGN